MLSWSTSETDLLPANSTWQSRSWIKPPSCPVVCAWAISAWCSPLHLIPAPSGVCPSPAQPCLLSHSCNPPSRPPYCHLPLHFSPPGFDLSFKMLHFGSTTSNPILIQSWYLLRGSQMWYSSGGINCFCLIWWLFFFLLWFGDKNHTFFCIFVVPNARPWT